MIAIEEPCEMNADAKWNAQFFLSTKITIDFGNEIFDSIFIVSAA